MSNRVDNDEKYWNETKTKGFSFNDDDDDSEDVANPWRKDLANTSELKLDLMRDEESLSVYSGLSEGSSEDDRLTRTDPLLNSDTPSFLLLDNINQGIEGIYKSSISSSTPSWAQRDDDKSSPLGFSAIKKVEEPFSGVGGLKHYPIREAIFNFMLGQDVPLESFKGLADKKLLLSKALELNEGNAILAIILFLQRTLKPSLFNQILMENPRAVNPYVHYLETKCDTSQLIDILNILGRTQETLIMRYKMILRSENNLTKLETQLAHFFKAECIISDAEISSYVKAHLNLIDTQKAIQATGSGSTTFRPGSSVLKTFNFLVEKHSDESTNSQLSPVNFRLVHGLNDKQYAWINLIALTKVQKWPQIESLLISKSWLSTSRDKCVLPLEDVVVYLRSAPVDLIAKFIRLVENADKRIALAKKYQCHMLVLDVYASQKDRASIISYKMKLDEKSKESVYAENLLKNSNTKWKN